MKHALVFAFLLGAFSVPAIALSADDTTIGMVRNTTGQAAVTRGDETFPAAAGTKLRAGDALSTGRDGAMGVILRDNSTLALGPESRLVLRSFLFAPAEGKLGLVARLTRGTMAYISGLIAKLAPETARFETPVATIGIRGTRFAVKADSPAPR